ncbi:MAG: hypothetical protein ACOKSU_27070 [Pseudomonas sp.]|uniref:hypothetical protein n=1 Tax=Pseudomonas TaxID=286 RepID=UPI0003C06CB2|nr:hypothetical protein [Pseudomonas sp. VLB120]AGZ34629.1 hypothetical protein PVLB_09155 [Pseudomonas sp. VLB120]
MSEKTIDQRVEELELVLRTLITFNIDATASLGRVLTTGNPMIAHAIAMDLGRLKSDSKANIDNALYSGYIDNLITGITGQA